LDLDKLFVSALLREGREAFEKARAAGAKDRLRGEGLQAFQFVSGYVRDYGEMPVPHQIEGRLGISLEGEDIFQLEDTPPKAFAWYLGEVTNRYLGETINTALARVSDLQADPRQAAELITRLAAQLQESGGQSRTESFFAGNEEVWQYYERIEAGERGVLTPWPSMNEATFGFWPEDLVLFAARLGTGKTFLMILLALHAWRNPDPKTGKPHKVLFITTEISQLRIRLRFFSVFAKLPYGDLTHGRLTHEGKHKFRKFLDETKFAEGIDIIGGDFDFSIGAVAAAIDASKPGIVILDGAYLLQADGNTRTERMANVFNDVKRLAKTKHVPIVITTQFNREVKKDVSKSVQVESIALSDVGGWNADLIFGMIQTEEMKVARQMIFKPLKVREGEGKEFMCQWDLSLMAFNELSTEGGGGGDADEHGTPLHTVTEDEGSNTDDGLPF